MSLATSLKSTAQRLLRTYGQNLSFNRVAEGAFVPSTGDVGSSTTTSFTAYGAPMSSSSSVTFDVMEGNQDTTQKTSLSYLIEVNDSSSVPAIGDVMDSTYRVQAVNIYEVQGATVIYKVQVKI